MARIASGKASYAMSQWWACAIAIWVFMPIGRMACFWVSCISLLASVWLSRTASMNWMLGTSSGTVAPVRAKIGIPRPSRYSACFLLNASRTSVHRSFSAPLTSYWSNRCTPTWPPMAGLITDNNVLTYS